ncbi:MAG: hypothetical protein KGL35_20310, partial [Bradyrhizobium sp.]|nr:hypothetical protein [Bradyrhizobium sp.]
ALIKAAYGEQSRQYQTELAREDVAHQGAIQRELAQTLDGIHKQAAARAGALEEKRAELNDRVALGQITIQQEIAQLRELTAASYKADEDELRSFAQSMGLRPAIVQKINEQIAALQLKASIADAKLQQQSTQQTIKEYGVGFNAIKAGFDTSINGIMQGTQTMSQAFARGAQTMVMSFARAAIDMAMTWAKQEAVMVIQHMTGEATKTAATAAGVATRVATQAAGAQAGAAIEKASTTPVIQSDAAKAAAGAYSALAGIPIIGPVIAPIAAGVAYAGVMAFGGGLAVGAYDVPQDMMAVIHQGEMVVPANFSQGIRSGAVTMGGPGGGGGNVGALNVTISAIDTQTGAAFLRAQLPTLAKQLAQHLNSNPSARPAY